MHLAARRISATILHLAQPRPKSTSLQCSHFRLAILFSSLTEIASRTVIVGGFVKDYCRVNDSRGDAGGNSLRRAIGMEPDRSGRRGRLRRAIREFKST